MIPTVYKYTQALIRTKIVEELNYSQLFHTAPINSIIAPLTHWKHSLWLKKKHPHCTYFNLLKINSVSSKYFNWCMVHLELSDISVSKRFQLLLVLKPTQHSNHYTIITITNKFINIASISNKKDKSSFNNESLFKSWTEWRTGGRLTASWHSWWCLEEQHFDKGWQSYKVSNRQRLQNDQRSMLWWGPELINHQVSGHLNKEPYKWVAKY